MTDKIKIETVNAAFKYLGEDPKCVPGVSKLSKEDKIDVLTNFNLKKVVKAINKKFNGGKIWIPNYADGSTKYEPWFWVQADAERPSGFGLSYDVYGHTYADTAVGARLSFISKEAFLYAYKYFPDLYKHHILILK